MGAAACTQGRREPAPSRGKEEGSGPASPVAPRHDDDAAAGGAHPRQLTHKLLLVCMHGGWVGGWVVLIGVG